MESWLSRITDYLLAQSWQIAVLIVVVAIVSFLLRNRSAHVRYLIWLLVLAKCLVPPLHSVPLAVLPQEQPIAFVESSPIAERTFDASRIERDIVTEPAKSTSVQTPMEPPPKTTEGPHTYNIRAWLAMGWLVGAVALLFYNLLNALRTQIWLQRQRTTLPVKFRHNVESFFSAHGVKHIPNVWLINGMNQPFVWGLVRGSIYLPADLLNFQDSKSWASLLGHELSHVVRFDAIVHTLQIFAQVVFWFHPFVWWANRKIRMEREKCCDEMTIVSLHALPEDYSEAIVEVLAVKYESIRPVPSLAVAGPVKNIEERIKTMLRPGKKFYKHPSLIISAIVVLISLITVPTALVLTARAQTDAVAEQEEKSVKSLHEAVKDGDLEQVKRLIAEGADVNLKDEDGRTALCIATRWDHTDIAELLIDKGANVNAPNRDGVTPLHDAVFKNNKEMVSLLISKGADVNLMRYRYNETPLHWAFWTQAVENRGVEIVKLLVDNGAKLDIKDISGYTVLRYAASWGLRDTVKLFLSKGVDISSLHMAACAGDLSRVKELIQKGTEVDTKDEAGWTALFWAASAGQEEVAEFLIDKGADISANDGDEGDGRSLLHQAAQTNAVKLAELLIAKGAEVNAKISFGTPLHLACERGNKDVVELLIDKGADINAKNRNSSTPLLQAARRGHKDVVELLIDKGADVNAKGLRGFTPLQGASSIGNLEVVKILISAGADVNVSNNMGQTPLNLAEQNGHTEVIELLKKHGAKKDTTLLGAAVSGDIEQVKLLISKGADVNAKNQLGKTPLHLAAQSGHKNVAELLIAKGADVNAKDNKGQTLLQWACFMNSKDIAKLLIAEGADVNVKNNANVTPLLTAATLGRITIAELLIDKSADVNAKNSLETTSLHMAARNGFKDMAELLIRNGADVNIKDNRGRTALSLAKEQGHEEIVELMRKHGAK